MLLKTLRVSIYLKNNKNFNNKNKKKITNNTNKKNAKTKQKIHQTI